MEKDKLYELKVFHVIFEYKVDKKKLKNPFYRIKKQDIESKCVVCTCEHEIPILLKYHYEKKIKRHLKFIYWHCKQSDFIKIRIIQVDEVMLPS